MAKGPGGIISGGFQPLKAPDAPTIDSVSAGVLSADVTFSAPADTGAGSVDSYVITAKQSDGSGVSETASAAGTVSLTLTAGGTTTFAAQAISNAFGPGQFSGFGNSTSVFSGQELYGFGSNNYGELGIATTTDRSSPTQVGALTNWSSFSAGFNHSVASKTDGTLWSWGNDIAGGLGIDTSYRTNQSSPVQVGALTNWSQVSAGKSFSVAIKTDGTLWSWGNGAYGQLGNNSTANRSSPIQVGSETNWSQVFAGSYHTAAVTTSGELYVWGNGGSGEIGNNAAVSTSSPVQVGALTNWSQVTCGGNTAAIKTDGTLWSWGNNGDGRVGDNTTISRSSPVQVGALTNWSQVTCGNQHTVAIKTSGTLWAWGNNFFGMLGINSRQQKSSPTQVGSLSTWSFVSAGRHTSAIKTDGTLWGWGHNGYGGFGAGRIGDNTAIDRSSPVQVGASTNWSSVSAGDSFSLAAIGSTS